MNVASKRLSEAQEQGGTFSGTNRPFAGAWGEDKPLPKGEHALQLYSMATPNGVNLGSASY